MQYLQPDGYTRLANIPVIAPMEGVKARLQVSTSPSEDRRLLPNLVRIVGELGWTQGLYRGRMHDCVCLWGGRDIIYVCHVYLCVHLCAGMYACALAEHDNS